MSRILLIALLTTLVAGCRKAERVGVPLTAVDISININNPSYANLQIPGGWLYLTGGSMGILVYRRSLEEFVALDRHCTYRPEDVCRVYVDDSQLVARDTTCCGSGFLITDGSVTQGPATLALQRYNTSFNGTVLRIYN